MIGKNISEDNLFGRNILVKIFHENIFLDNNIIYEKYLRVPPGKKNMYNKYVYILSKIVIYFRQFKIKLDTNNTH